MIEYPGLDRLAADPATADDLRLEVSVALADMVRIRHHIAALTAAADAVLDDPADTAALSALSDAVTSATGRRFPRGPHA